MKPYTRKLFLYYDPTPYSYSATSTANDISSPPSSSSSSSSFSKTAPPYQNNPPFDFSMALTIVVLLIALFFMGFFSIYLRRISQEDPSTSRRRYPRGGPVLDSFLLPMSELHHHVSSASRKGLDPTTIQSLPVYFYHGNYAKYLQIDCPICLSEFEDKECVKTIPYCKHVFHVACIDTWLSSHVSCPVCRATMLFEINGSGGGSGPVGGLGVNVMQERSDHQGGSQSSTVDINDTCMVMEIITPRVRRTRSCSSLGERATLQRTLSF